MCGIRVGSYSCFCSSAKMLLFLTRDALWRRSMEERRFGDGEPERPPWSIFSVLRFFQKRRGEVEESRGEDWNGEESLPGSAAFCITGVSPRVGDEGVPESISDPISGSGTMRDKQNIRDGSLASLQGTSWDLPWKNSCASSASFASFRLGKSRSKGEVNCLPSSWLAKRLVCSWRYEGDAPVI